MSLRPVCALALLLVWTLPARGERPPEFSAQLELKSPAENLSLTLQVKGASYRLEGEVDGQQRILLRDRQARTITVVDSRAKTYEVLEGFRGAMLDPLFAWELARQDLKKTVVGKTELDGRAIEHWRFTHPTQKDFILEVWHSPELGHFVKQSMEMRGQRKEMVLRKITPGPVAASRLQPPADHARKKTPEEIEAALPSLSKVASGQAPLGRRVSAGGELRVKLDPTRKVTVSAESRIAGETVVTATPFKGGKIKENIGVNPWTLTRVGDRHSIDWNDNFSMFGETFQIDEVRIRVTKGLCRIKVDQDAKDGKDAYLFGGGTFWGHGKPGGTRLTITGDHQAGPSSRGTLVLSRKSGKSSEAFELKNGASKTWKLDGEVQSFSIEVPLGEGGLKIRSR